MSFAISPNLQQAYAALSSFIITVLGVSNLNTVQGLGNRVSMPGEGFILIQAVKRHRLATNLHTYDETDPSPTTAAITESIEITMQIDCYGAQSSAEVIGAEDWANILSATLRDEYGCTALAPTLSPLYADDATMIPLTNAEEQYEERWMVEAHFEFDPTTTIPQQYANTLKLKMWDVPLQAPY
jgi:antitoxin component of MazEF toxin-antitoxin module